MLRKITLAAACAGTALLVTAPTSQAVSLPADSTAILSGGPSLFDALPTPAGDSYTGSSAVSSDGRYVAFVSSSDGLLPDDNDYVTGVYVKDRVSGSVTLVSRATGPEGKPADDVCHSPAISDDGGRVAFVCDGPLDNDDRNETGDVYLRDLGSASTYLVSRASKLGAAGDGSSSAPSLSANGEYVAFASWATNFVQAGIHSEQRIYRRQIGSGNETILISRPTTPAAAFSPGARPSISDDGNRIAFQSSTSMDGVDTNFQEDVYVRDVSAATTGLVSRASGPGPAGLRESTAAAISGDGTAVAFETEAANLDSSHDSDTDPDIYRRTITGPLADQETVVVNPNGAGESTEPSIDRSGNVVAFVSTATTLVSSDKDPAPDAYVVDLARNDVDVLSRADGRTGKVANTDANWVAVSGDGGKFAITLTKATIVPGVDPNRWAVILRDHDDGLTLAVSRPPGDAPFVSDGGTIDGGDLNSDGRFAAFVSSATGVGLPEGVRQGVFVRDRVTGQVELVSRKDGPGGEPFGDSISEPVISDDGRRVAFTVIGRFQTMVWVRDVAEGRTYLASRADGADGAPANDGAHAPSLDADGSRVAFASGATNLGDGDTDDTHDIHVRDLETGRTLLASRASGADGAKGDESASQPDLSADGTRVLFRSLAKNLAPGDTDTYGDFYLRDLASSETLLVSASPDGVNSDGDVESGSIDAAGTRVAFSAASQNLLGIATPDQKVFVRDLAAGTLVLASRVDGADGEVFDSDAQAPVISPDGGHVAFNSDAGNAGLGAPAGIVESYLRDLGAGRTTLVSRRGGAAGTPAARRAYTLAVTSGGGCVAFATDEALIGPSSEDFQLYLRAVRANCGDPVAGAGPGGGAGGGPGAGKPSADRTAPLLSRAKLSRRRFRVGRGATAVSAGLGRGTKLSFRSSEAGKLALKFERVVRVKAKGKRVRKRTKYRAAGALTRRIRAGAGSVAFSGRLGKKRLAPGIYRLTLTATDGAGNRSKPVRLQLTIVKG